MATQPQPSPEARAIVAEAIAAEGSAYRNLSEHVRDGNDPNMWIRFALRATDYALHRPLDE